MAGGLGEEHGLLAVELLGDAGQFVFEGDAFARDGEPVGGGQVLEPAAQAAGVHG